MFWLALVFMRLELKKLEEMVDTTDEWIKTRTGIKERRILDDPNKATSYLAIKAAKDLIIKNNIDTSTIDKSIFGTGKFFKEQSYMIAITKGAEGSVVINNGQEIFSPAMPITPVDTNGAGDMYAGSFMHAYLNGLDLSECAEFSNFASSKIVETFGPRLTPEGYKEVLNKLKKS